MRWGHSCTSSPSSNQGKCYGPNCIPPKMLRSKPQVPVNVTSFGNRVFAGIQGHMRSLEWALSPLRLCPYKKENGMCTGRILCEDWSFAATAKELSEAKK